MTCISDHGNRGNGLHSSPLRSHVRDACPTSFRSSPPDDNITASFPVKNRLARPFLCHHFFFRIDDELPGHLAAIQAFDLRVATEKCGKQDVSNRSVSRTRPKAVFRVSFRFRSAHLLPDHFTHLAKIGWTVRTPAAAQTPGPSKRWISRPQTTLFAKKQKRKD